jgi:hypothetical protein
MREYHSFCEKWENNWRTWSQWLKKQWWLLRSSDNKTEQGARKYWPIFNIVRTNWQWTSSFDASD